MDLQKLKVKFYDIFAVSPRIFRSPGRINIIGEHTDYNGGFVLPAAIDKAIYVAVSTRNDDQIRLFSIAHNQHHDSDLQLLSISDKGWPNYILGIADQLLKRGFGIGGFNLVIDGDIPLGAGLSSSAAVECATGYALSNLFDLSISRIDLAFIAQKAEHTFAGVNCGIMDQFASVFGKKDEAMMLDCRSMAYEYVPLDLGAHKLVLFNTNVKHALAESAYNKRRAACEQGVVWIREKYTHVETLRDADITMLDECVRDKDADIYEKCRFVISETERVRRAVAHLRKGELTELGKLMFEAHDGLSQLYQVSCKELDFLVDAVRSSPAVKGARMMGGGFGGCTLNIIEEDAIEELVSDISKRYEREFGLKMEVYAVETGEGTSEVNG